MGNGQGVTNPCAEITLDIESTAKEVAANFGIPDAWIVPFPITYIRPMYSGFSWRIKRSCGPAGNMMYAAENFGLITQKQCDEGLNDWSTRIHARHMKRQQKKKGTKKRWTREFRNNKFKW